MLGCLVSLIDNPFIGATLLFHVVILWMKLLSDALANEDYRLSSDDSAATLEALVKDLDEGAAAVTYPSNVTLPNSYYFWMAPTLTYQIAFPSNPQDSYLASFVLDLSVCAGIELAHLFDGPRNCAEYFDRSSRI
jgi:diacylglycerol O-acyltransferase-1